MTRFGSVDWTEFQRFWESHGFTFKATKMISATKRISDGSTLEITGAGHIIYKHQRKAERAGKAETFEEALRDMNKLAGEFGGWA